MAGGWIPYRWWSDRYRRVVAGAHLRTEDLGPDRRWWMSVVIAFVIGSIVGGSIVGAATRWVSGEDDPSTTVAAGPGAGEESPNPTATSAPPEPAPTTTTEARGPVTLAFVGDINVERSLADRLRVDPTGFLGPFASIVSDADLAIGNLEAALTTTGAPMDKAYNFRAPEAVLDALFAGGLDVLSAANNHAVDFGQDGLADTLAILGRRPDRPVIGIGADEAAAYAPFRTTIHGQRLAVIAATQVLDDHLLGVWTATESQAGVASAKRVDRLAQAVAEARAEADTVVVFLHWGIETQQCPSRAQQDLATRLVDAGADVIVGTHAHRVQGAGRMGDALVGYGLGNFLFGASSAESARTGVLTVTVEGREVLDYAWHPGRIVDRVPRPLEGAEATAALADWEGRRPCTGLEP